MNDSALKRPLVVSTLRRSIVVALVSSVLSGCASLTGPDRLEIPANTSDFRTRVYTGAAFGSSRLTPDTSGTVFDRESSSDTGTQLRLGYDVHNMLAVELDTSVLGASELRQADTEVSYSAAAVSALIYGLSGNQLRSRREGLSAYGRFGYGALKKSSAVLPLDDSGMVPILGLGAEYGFSNGLGIRAEATRFDDDVSFVGFGAIFRFGVTPSGLGRMIAQAAEPALGAAHTTVAADGRVLTGRARGRNELRRTDYERHTPTNPEQGAQHYSAGAQSSTGKVATIADRWRPAMRAGDADADGVMDNLDNCPDTNRHVTVDRHGCGLFDAVLEDVTFKSGSFWLTPRARGQLDRVAETLLAFPESRVQVRAHTDSQGPADANLNLSSRRAEVVVQYLQSRGVHELQLQAVGMGEAQPLVSNSSKAGRRNNRRIDIVTLPDQDAGQLLIPASVGTARVIAVADATEGRDSDDTYKLATDEWNSAPPLPAANATVVARNGKSSDHDEPALQAAKPAAKTTSSPVSRSIADAIALLPAPGFAPGVDIGGIVEGVSFEPGSAELTTGSKSAFTDIVRSLNENPDIRIAVMAHTDNSGGIEENLRLSTARATSVVEYLVDKGVEPARLKAEGYGEMLPLVQNVTDEDRARNRRIEIRILRTR